MFDPERLNPVTQCPLLETAVIQAASFTNLVVERPREVGHDRVVVAIIDGRLDLEK